MAAVLLFAAFSLGIHRRFLSNDDDDYTTEPARYRAPANTFSSFVWNDDDLTSSHALAHTEVEMGRILDED